MSAETVTLEGVTALRETARALLVELDGDERWIPKSVIHDDSEVWEPGQEGALVLLAWWAEKEGVA